MTTRHTALASLLAALIGSALLASPAFAQKKELSPQQQRMGECAHEGKGKKGDDYKQFMKECLKSKKDAAAAAPAAKPAATAAKTTAAPAAPASTAATKQAAAAGQKDKMKSCNAQAKDKSLKGAARKTFMSDCLKA